MAAASTVNEQICQRLNLSQNGRVMWRGTTNDNAEVACGIDDVDRCTSQTVSLSTAQSQHLLTFTCSWNVYKSIYTFTQLRHCEKYKPLSCATNICGNTLLGASWWRTHRKNWRATLTQFPGTTTAPLILPSQNNVITYLIMVYFISQRVILKPFPVINHS